ncbi:MAG TPA: hypothetical protein VL944_00410 [Candidatus Acidoferrum sp.]|nr:hypothetical protein [Candidatus Acidoferrum sp.]
MKGLDNDIENISKYLTQKQNDFDSVMQISREIIRDAGQAITMLHNEDNAVASKKITDMKAKAKRLSKMDKNFKYNTMQAYQEYAEAVIFQNIKSGKEIPTAESLDIDNEAYLMGLMDVEGELKREILEALRKNRLKLAESYFDTMKRIYDSTRRLRFAEAVLSGFRKKQDTARIQIENAGSEILMFKSRK